MARWPSEKAKIMNCVAINGGTSFHSRRFFASSLGVALPLRLVSELEPEAIKNRNTFFVAYFDASNRMLGCDNMVYGDRVFHHRYEYHEHDAIRRAVIFADGEEQGMLVYDEVGKLLDAPARSKGSIVSSERNRA